jgi:hypothetical protein
VVYRLVETIEYISTCRWHFINGKNKIEMTTFCRNEQHCQKTRTTDKPRKNKIYDNGKEKHIKANNRIFETQKSHILKS